MKGRWVKLNADKGRIQIRFTVVSPDKLTSAVGITGVLVGYAATENGSDGVAGQIEIAGDLTKSLSVNKMGLTNFTDGFHDQHLLFSPLSDGVREYGAECWGGSILDADYDRRWVIIARRSTI
jgi:hypothetical protein